MTIDISILKQFVDTRVAEGTGAYPVGITSVGSAPAGDLSNYYTKTQINAGVINPYYVARIIDASVFGTKNWLGDNFFNLDISVGGRLDTLSDVSLGGGLTIISDFETGGDGNIIGSLSVDGEITGNGGLTIAADASLASVKTDSIESLTTSYVPGFLGAGYKTDSEGNAEVKSLSVRETLRANIFEISKTEFIAGTQVISPGGGVAATGLIFSNVADEWYFTVEASSFNTFAPTDRIIAQQRSGYNIFNYEWRCTSINEARVYVQPWDRELRDNDDGPGGSFGMSDINMGSFADSGGFGYDLVWDANNQYCKTDYFTLSGKGKVLVIAAWTHVAGGGALTMQIFDGDDTPISEFVYENIDEEALYEDFHVVGVGFSGDTSCYIRMGNAPIGTELDNFGIWAVADQTLFGDNVEGVHFATLGSGNIARQSAIVSSSVDAYNPYTMYLRDLSTGIIKDENIAVKVGNLAGYSVADVSAWGMGFAGDNVFVSGHANINSGEIGGMTADSGSLSSDGSDGSFTLSGRDIRLSFFDSDNVEKITIKPGELTTLSALIGGTTLTYLDASCVGADIAYNDIPNIPGAIFGNVWKYIQTTGGNVYDYSSDQGNSYHFDVEDDVEYSFTYKIRASNTVNLDTDTSTQRYFAAGIHLLIIAIEAYNSDDNLLFENEEFFVGGGPNTSIDYELTGNLGIVPNAVYFKVNYSGSNRIYQTSEERIEFKPGRYIWVPGPDKDITTDFLFETTYIQLVGATGKTEISDNGFQTVHDNDEYFRADGDAANTVADPFLKTAGTWVHSGGSLAIKAGLILRITTVAGSTYNILESDILLNCTYGSGGGTITLPSSPDNGRTYIISNNSAETKTIIGGSKNIIRDGAITGTTFNLGTGEGIMLSYNGSKWATATKYA